MSRVSAGLVGVFLVCVSTSASAQQPPRDIQPIVGRSTIRGRITSVDTGQPMHRAAVRVSGAALRGARMTLSDAEGPYEFALPAPIMRSRSTAGARQNGRIQNSWKDSAA